MRRALNDSLEATLAPDHLSAFVADLRALGVTKISIEITPQDTIPAPAFPALQDELSTILGDEPREAKDPGLCASPGCNAPNGHRFAPNYCRDHALELAGAG